MKHKREEVERNTRDSHSDLGLSLVIYSPLSVLSVIALAPLGKNIEECVSGMRLVRARHLKGRENKRRGAEGSLCDCGVRRAPCVRAPAFVERSRTVAFLYSLLYPAKSIRPDRHVICSNTEPVLQSPLDFSLSIVLFMFVSLFRPGRIELSRIPLQTSGSVESCEFMCILCIPQDRARQCQMEGRGGLVRAGVRVEWTESDGEREREREVVCSLVSLV